MPNNWIVILLFSSVTAQYYGGYYGRYGWGTPMTVDPYNAANAYALRGMVVDPAVSGVCADTNMQCPVWASTGQCATNPLVMRRMCALSCGTCGIGLEYGMGAGLVYTTLPFEGAPGLGYGLGTGLGAAGLGYGGMGLNPLAAPLLGRSIYEQEVDIWEELAELRYRSLLCINDYSVQVVKLFVLCEFFKPVKLNSLVLEEQYRTHKNMLLYLIYVISMLLVIADTRQAFPPVTILADINIDYITNFDFTRQTFDMIVDVDRQLKDNRFAPNFNNYTVKEIFREIRFDDVESQFIGDVEYIFKGSNVTGIRTSNPCMLGNSFCVHSFIVLGVLSLLHAIIDGSVLIMVVILRQ
ncbi:unnamed protein product [Haemonchus placei]|uniref:ShKT domain-containing protein n=1 Tax=Haemonchus placei TaxID=6290 RepID=A0A158QQD6_HAEPC|nr:unnamed protein product [Haemonchus placei]